MCIIVVKQKGVDYPSRDTIKQCMKANPDGFGIAWNEKGQLKNFRTMDEEEMLKQWDYVSGLDPQKTAVLFHARIATHGSKKLENCHCWIEGGVAFAHNGVLNNVFVHDDMTDSECFFRDIVLPVYKAARINYKNRKSENGKRLMGLVPGMAIKALCGTSRLAFLNANGEFSLFGSFVKNTEEGKTGPVYYSNNSYINYADYTRQFGGVFSYSCMSAPTSRVTPPSMKHTLRVIGEGPSRVKEIAEH